MSSAPVCTRAEQQVAAQLFELIDPSDPPADGELYYLNKPLAEIAAQSGRSRRNGTIYRHGSVLQHLGVLQRAPGRTGWLVDVPRLRTILSGGPRPVRPHNHIPPGHPRPEPAPNTDQRTRQPLPSAGRPVQPGRTLDRVISLSERVVALVEAGHATDDLIAGWRSLVAYTEAAHAELPAGGLAELGAQDLVRESPIANARTDREPTSRSIREVASSSRTTGSPDRREGERVFPVYKPKNLSPSLSDRSRDARFANERDARSAHDQGANEPAKLRVRAPDCPVMGAPPPEASQAEDREISPRSNEKLRELIGPLERAAAARKLVPVTDLAGVRASLASYNDDQIRQAVRTVLRMTEQGLVTKSPVGWLLARARQEDLNYFTTPPPPATPPPPTVPRPEPVTNDDQEAEMAVTALEESGPSPELEAFDTWARARTPGADRLICAGGLHHFRVGMWRSWQTNRAGVQ